MNSSTSNSSPAVLPAPERHALARRVARSGRNEKAARAPVLEFDFARPVPKVPWRGVLAAVVLLTLAAMVGWEMHVRSRGYAPTLNDTGDLWSEARSKVKPDSIVLLGTSRMLFDIDLDVLERGLGQRPVQLALVGSSPLISR